MSRMLSFTKLTGDGIPVYINAAAIQVVEPALDGAIVYLSDFHLRVKENAATVLAALKRPPRRGR